VLSGTAQISSHPEAEKKTPKVVSSVLSVSSVVLASRLFRRNGLEKFVVERNPVIERFYG